jgi:hypothetical protein
MFEPTPNRGAPNAPWTMVPPAQDVSTETVPMPTTSASVGTGTAMVDLNPAPPTTETIPSTTTPAAEDQPATETRRHPLWPLLNTLLALVAIAVVAAGLAAVVLLYATVLERLRDRQRHDRRARANNASRQVLVAWQECLEALWTVDLVPRRAEGRDEFARRVAPRLGDAGPDLIALAEAVDQADFAPDLVADAVADQASAAARVVTESAAFLATPAQQWRSRLDPRPLLGASGTREPQNSIAM